MKLFIIQVNGFMQSRESDDPCIRSARLAKDALHHAQVIYTCMSLQFIQMVVSCMPIIYLLLCISNFYCVGILQNTVLNLFIFSVHYKQTHCSFPCCLTNPLRLFYTLFFTTSNYSSELFPAQSSIGRSTNWLCNTDHMMPFITHT